MICGLNLNYLQRTIFVNFAPKESKLPRNLENREPPCDLFACVITGTPTVHLVNAEMFNVIRLWAGSEYLGYASEI